MEELFSHETLSRVIEENELLREEVRVARRASEITAKLVVEQFVKTEKILRLLEETATNEKELRKTVELGMDSSSYVIPLAKAYLLQGKIEQAIQLAQPIEGADSLLNAEILVVQAEAYFAAHDLDKANFLYRNILSANPELVSALIGSVRLNLAENNHEKASLDLLKLLSCISLLRQLYH